MKKLVFLATLLAFFVFAGVVSAKTSHGEALESEYEEFGTIKYLGNPSGYHFWFTMNDDLGRYINGHSYHNIYKLKVEDQSGWCGPVYVPDRSPYSLVEHTGKYAYYKIYDVTMDMYVCGSE